MAGIKEKGSGLRTYTEDRQLKDIAGIVVRFGAIMVDYNVMQLMDGKTSTGGFVEPPYASPKYAEIKLHMNPKGVVDLNFTGSFHNNFFVKTKQFPIQIWSRDSKTNELVSKYEEEIFGLDPENKGLFVEDIKEEVQKYYKSVLGL